MQSAEAGTGVCQNVVGKQVVCHGVCILCPPTNVGEVAVVEVDCSSRAGGANRRSALAP